MPLKAGDKLGPYEILAPIGAGGMGEVYRAKDTKLDREVAIKVLPESLAHDPDRLARFEREAKVLASLNHPNIAQIYGIEECALVMELVPGETLKGPLLLAIALDYAKQIVEALEAAHERGIVHRDLKPGNIMVTAAGVVKLLDFGLAKAAEEPVSDMPNSPTITISPTRAGVILGTAPYMAPEQARGKPVDKRADIWAFGCVLYEMLTGKQAFTGETTTDILAAVVTKEPDLSRVPAKARRLIESCLKKDPKQRLQAIGDWRLLLENGEPAAAQVHATPWIATAAVAILIAVAGWWVAWQATRPVDRPLTRLSVDLGPNAMTGVSTTVAISPDGRRIVYPARGPEGKQQLATRLLDQSEATLLPGTEDGRDPFFSPDGQWIGFYTRDQLKKISVEGGAPVTLAAVPSVTSGGASWSADGTIIEAHGLSLPLSRIPAAGGAPQVVTKLGNDEFTHRWPQVLPGVDAVLFTASSSNSAWENASIEAISLKTGQVKILERGGYYGRYLPSGHLVYVHHGVLFGVRFDPVKLEVSGTPVPILEDVAANPATGGGGQFDFSWGPSGHGTFVYLAGKSTAQAWQVDWLDSSGKMQPLIAQPGAYAQPRLSPDERKLAFVGDGSDIYIHDLARGTTSRLTLTGHGNMPVWAPNGKHLVFQSAGSLSWLRSDGAGEAQRLLEGPNAGIPWSFSPDGRRLAYFTVDPRSGFDLWTLPLDLTDPDHPKAGKPELFLRTPANELAPRFSPDGRWIAYRSDESGSNEIYVRPFRAASGGKWQISSGGGLYPFWAKDGRQLFYETADNRIMVVDYTVDGASLKPGKPRLWSDKQLFYAGSSNLDLAPDGKHFVVLEMPETAKSSPRVVFLLNFFDELRRRVPAGK